MKTFEITIKHYLTVEEKMLVSAMDADEAYHMAKDEYEEVEGVRLQNLMDEGEFVFEDSEMIAVKGIHKEDY